VQLNRLATRLAALPGRALVVVAHHPPDHPPNHPSRPLHRAALLREWLGGRNVRALLTGHLHRHRMGHDGATILLDAPTALSHRLRGEANGYNILELECGRTRLRIRRHAAGEWTEEAAIDAPSAATKP
jgi:hypothetical protein